MAINFPTSLDNFTNPASGNTLDSPSHSLQHSDLNDAVEALERKVGLGTAVAGSASAGQVLTISAAGTSTWSTPTTPGLVQVVPTSISVSGSGSSGSVDANGTITFTSSSTININGCFSATYQNYLFIYNFDSAAGGNAIKWNGRTSGTTNTSNVYYYAVARNRSSAASLTSYDRGTPSTYVLLGEGNTGVATGNITIYNPFVSKATEVGGLVQNNVDFYWTGGHYDDTTSFDGFAITLNNLSAGTFRIYGFRN